MDLIMLPMVTEPLILNATEHLAKTSPLGYSDGSEDTLTGVSEGMLIDVEIVLEYARETYQRWLNERTYKLGNVVIFSTRGV